MVRSFSTLGGGIGVRVKGLGTGTLILSVAITSLELMGIKPGIFNAILDVAESVTFMAIVEPAKLTVELLAPNGPHVLDLVTGSPELVFAFLGNHVVLLLCFDDCIVESRERRETMASRRMTPSLGMKDPSLWPGTRRLQWPGEWTVRGLGWWKV